MLIRALERRGIGDVDVASAGELLPDQPASTGTIEALARRQLDVSTHRSRQLVTELVSEADLVLGMARRHVRAAAILAPGAFAKTFTLKELVRRGEVAGNRQDGEAFEDWLGRVADGRTAAEMLGDDPADEVEDPIGRPPLVYEAVAAELDDLISRLVDLAWARP